MATAAGSGENAEEQMRTFKEFLSNYNKLSERCFSDCVWGFTSRKVTRGEDSCALNCAEKYLKMNQRISTRFQVISYFYRFPAAGSPKFLPKVHFEELH